MQIPLTIDKDNNMAEFKRVGLIGRLGSTNVQASLKNLISFINSRGIDVVLERETATILPGHDMEVCTYETLGKSCDLAIVVGGDGSILAASRALVKYKIPILGVNRGRLGFLTDIAPDDIDILVGEVLDGKYLMEERFLLEMTVQRNGQWVSGGDAMNDVVIHPGQFIRMIEFELYVDEHFVYRQRSDGLIISTPTGSTAYALSGGGPLMHPKLDAIVLVPMHAHALNSRPIVVDGSSDIKIIISSNNTAKPHVTCDGQTHVITEPSDEILIHKKSRKVKLMHPLNHNFYETCRSKLGWSS